MIIQMFLQFIFFICSYNFFYDGTNSLYDYSHIDSLEDHSFILTVFSYNVFDDNVSNVSSCNSDDDSSDVYDFYFLIFSSSLRNWINSFSCSMIFFLLYLS